MKRKRQRRGKEEEEKRLTLDMAVCSEIVASGGHR